jgi:hypothetical protein
MAQKGLLRSIPVKSPSGQPERWIVKITDAGEIDRYEQIKGAR